MGIVGGRTECLSGHLFAHAVAYFCSVIFQYTGFASCMYRSLLRLVRNFSITRGSDVEPSPVSRSCTACTENMDLKSALICAVSHEKDRASSARVTWGCVETEAKKHRKVHKQPTKPPATMMQICVGTLIQTTLNPLSLVV